MTDQPPATPPLVVWDPAAYRRLAAAAGDVPSAARAQAIAAAADAARAGVAPAASPFTLWALLADLAPRAGDAGGRAQAALAACVAHTSDGTSLRLAPDPETQLAQAALGRVPPQHAAWNAYLASLAADAAGALLAAPGGARRLAVPLAHVVDRAAQQTADAEDELQDAVVAAYEAGARGWDPGAGVAERQTQVAADEASLAAAVAAGRATRAAALVATAKDRDASGAVLTDPAVLTLAARRVRSAFAPGVRVWAEVVRGIISERVTPGGRGWRGAVWGAQVAFAVGGGPDAGDGADDPSGGVARVVTGSDVLRAAAEAAGVDVVASA
jgi:hypothetical protein